MRNANKTLQILLTILIIATIVFIFGNSVMPPDLSSKQSDGVASIIEKIIPIDTTFGSFIHENIRKIAHFTEYGLLGIEIAIYVMLYAEEKLKQAAFSTFIPFAVGFTDETIQIFSGRGPSVADVWIDVGGFLSFSLLTYSVSIVLIFTRALCSRK